MTRAIAKAKKYAESRKILGSLLRDNELHTHTLLQMEALYRGCLYMTLDAANWLNQTEKNPEDEESANVLRFVTPLVKAFTAKAAMTIISEALECMGGIGYMENSGMPRLLRDAQVYPIWEGTTNVQALDLRRVFSKKNKQDVMQPFEKCVKAKVAGSAHESLFSNDFQRLRSIADTAPEHLSREILMALSRMYAFSCLCEVASKTKGGSQSDEDVATAFLESQRSLWKVEETTITGEAAQRIIYSKL